MTTTPFLRRAALTVSAALPLAWMPLVSTAGAQTGVSSEAELRAAFATDDVVVLEDDITLTDCEGGGALERTVTDEVLLDGNGFTLRQTCEDNVIVQENVGAETMTIRDLTVTGGEATGSGGGIFAMGDLVVERSAIVDNRAAEAGGGIAANGAITLESTLVDGNTAEQVGGGIASNLELTIVASTISGNTGGGITTSLSPEARTTIVNSTITGNVATGDSIGGGIAADGELTMAYVTLTDNTAGTAFGNLALDGTGTVFGTVITGGKDGGGNSNCLATGLTSQGYNYSDDDSCHLTHSTDRQDAPPPGLGALGDNGGPTPTQLPATDSPLVGAIPDSACQTGVAAGVTVDQRGIARPQQDGCDIGAVELELVAPEPLEPTSTTTTVAPRPAAPAPVSRANPSFTG